MSRSPISRKRLLSALQSERQDAERFDAIRREANILASYQSRITPGSAEVTLPDVYGSGDITVRLDPSIAVREQIKKRFRLAAKLERKGAAIDKRVRVVDAEIASLEDALGAAGAQRELRDAVSLIDRLKQRHRLDAGPPRTAKAHQRQKEFRQYELDPLWFVIVGRSDRENDEITFRIAGPDDIWLHAQHVAGSHVILKSRGTRANPPNPVLEAAARIAAHYSKARRASMVPVIYTRRKYVRKFRGAKPGQVLCEREKTILAVPKLPESTGD